MKKILIFLATLTIIGCSSTTTKSGEPETEQQQVNRLIKLAEQREEEKRIEEEKRLKEEAKVTVEKEVIVNEEAINVQQPNQSDVEVVVPESEVVIEEEQTPEVKNEKKVDPLAGKTRGEQMVYEMNRITEEMNKIQENVQDYVKRSEMLNEYKAKLEKLKQINNVGM